MTGAELEVVDRRPTEVAIRGAGAWLNSVADVVELAELVGRTDFVPRGLRGNVPATTAAIMYGREVGFEPMTALQQVYVIDGRPAIYAEAMRALILAAGHELAIDKATGAECVVRGRRKGSPDWSEPIRWTLDMARAAGLDQRAQWKKNPRSMLVARATTDLARWHFADVIHGFRSVEEAYDIDDEERAELEPAPKRTRVARKRATKTADAEVPAAPVETSAPASPPVAPPALPPLPGEAELDVEPVSRDQDPRAGRGPRYQDDDDPLPEDLQPHGTGRPKRPLDARELVVRDIVLHFGRMGLDSETDRDQRLMLTGRIVGREIRSTNELSVDEAGYVLATIRVIKNLADLRRILDVVDAPPEETP